MALDGSSGIFFFNSLCICEILTLHIAYINIFIHYFKSNMSDLQLASHEADGTNATRSSVYELVSQN